MRAPPPLVALLAAALLASTAPPSLAGVSPPCGLCPPGYSFEYPDGGTFDADSIYSGLTCGDVDSDLSDRLSEGDAECASARADAAYTGSGIPPSCGYCVRDGGGGEEEGGGDPCSICAGGSAPALGAGVVVPGEPQCGAVAYGLLIGDDGVGTDGCSEGREYYGQLCGCPLDPGGPPPCEVCPGGTGAVPDLDAPSPTLGATCGDLQLRAGFVPSDGWLCLELSVASMFECGCDYVPPPDPRCSLCAGGGVPDPLMSLSGDGAYTCGALEWDYGFYGDDEGLCDAARATFGAGCGCSDPPDPACPVPCPNGTEFDFGGVVDDASQMLCVQALHDLSAHEEECTDEDVASVAAGCCKGSGSPPPPPCGLCPGGTEVQFPDATYDEGTGETCSQLHERLADVPVGDRCLEARYGLLDFGPSLVPCGYCVPSAGAADPDLPAACTLCADGAVPAPPAADDAELCSFMHYRLLITEEAGSDECVAERSETGPLCGCPAEGPACEICPGAAGGEITEPDEYSVIFGALCGDLQERARLFPADSELCLEASVAAMLECGCEYVPPPDTSCPLCANGTGLLDPAMSLDPYDPLSSCGSMEWENGFFPTTEGECSATQAVIGPLCGCPSPPEPTCNVPCPEGTELLPTADVWLQGDFAPTPCYDLLWELSAYPETCNEDNVTYAASQCCGDPPPPCGVCPAGFKFSDPGAVFNDTEPDVTCGAVEESMVGITEDDMVCAFMKIAFFMDPPDQCGYCVGPPEEACTLCWDGSEPTVPADQDTIIGMTCGHLAFLTLFQEAGSENCTEAQEMVWQLCGCPPPDGVDVPEGTCGFCPEGMTLQNPTAVANATTGETCADLDEALADIPAGVFCGFAKSSLLDDFPSQCGYCVPSADADTAVRPDTCTLCADGSVPELPPTTVVAEEFQCAQLAFGVSFIEAGTQDCVDTQGSMGLMCGCPVDGPTCPICPDGISSVPQPEVFSEITGLTCSEMQSISKYVAEDHEMCILGSVSAMLECQCKYVPPTKSNCTLCVDGKSVEDPLFSLDPNDPSFTCGMAEWQAKYVGDFGTEQECSALQATMGAVCGCSDPPDPACDPECPTGTKFDLKEEYSVGNETIMCGERIFDMSSYKEECTLGNVELVKGSCCVSMDANATINTAPTASPIEDPTEESDGNETTPTTSPIEDPTEELDGNETAPTNAPVDRSVDSSSSVLVLGGFDVVLSLVALGIAIL